MMKRSLENALKREFEGSVFVRNIGWFWAGAALSIAGLVISALLLPESDGFVGLFAAGWSGIWWGVILTVAWGSIKGVISSQGVLAQNRLRRLPAVSDSLWHRRRCGSRFCDFLRGAVAGHRDAGRAPQSASG